VYLLKKCSSPLIFLQSDYIYTCYIVFYHLPLSLLSCNPRYYIIFVSSPCMWCGPGSSVSTATGYGLDGPGIESRRGEIFRTCPDRPWGPSSLLYNGYGLLPESKERPGRDADPSPLLVPWSRKSRAIPLLPLWPVRPVKSLNACTSAHFTFTLISARGNSTMQ